MYFVIAYPQSQNTSFLIDCQAKILSLFFANLKKVEFLLNNKEIDAEKLRKNFYSLYMRLEAELGLDRKTIASMAGVNPSVVGKMINMVSPSTAWHTVYVITRALGITLEDLVERHVDETFLKVKKFLGKSKKA